MKRLILSLLFISTIYSRRPELIWSATIDNEGNEDAYDVTQTTDGGYVFVGATTNAGTAEDFWLVKTDSVGNQLWEQSFDCLGEENWEQSEFARSVQQTPDGGYILAGYSSCLTGGGGAGFGGWDGWVIKTDANGQAQFTYELEAILNIRVEKVDGNSTYNGVNIIRLLKGKSVTKVVEVVEIN